MFVKLASRGHVALLLLAVVAGCRSEEPTENTRKVQGSLSAESLVGLGVPSVVAQDANGNTFDGPVAKDGSFSLTLPTGPSYRLFITDLQASGRQATESSLLWPGRQTWGVVAAGTTADAAPIDVGSVMPDSDDVGVGGAGGGATGGGATGGTAGAGATGDGSSEGGEGSGGSGSGGGGGSDGATGGSGTGGSGATGDGTNGDRDRDDGAGGDGKSGKGGGPSLCTPPKMKTSVCTGSVGGSGGGGVAASGCEADLPYDAKLPEGATYFLEQSFWEKGPSPVKILNVTVEGGHRQKELASNTPFVVTAEDCAHVGNKDVGRDRIFVTWQNANGSTETDHLDMRYCKDGGPWNPGPPKTIPDSCLSAKGSAPGASDIPACAPERSR